MADTKITQLFGLDAFASGDLIPMVDDPTGIPETKKATIDQVRSFVATSSNNFTGNNNFTNPVGIGTNSPDGLLTVRAANSSSFDVSNPSGSTLQLSNYITTTGASIVRKVLSGIQGLVGSTDSASYQGSLAFLTTPSAGSPTERMRINASGNVGINTNSPSYKLHVVESGSASAIYGISTGGSGIQGISTTSYGARGTSTDGTGVYGISTNSYGINGVSTTSIGGYFLTSATTSIGCYARNLGTGVYYYGAYNLYGFYTNGNGLLTGSLSKGSGSFNIPHPLPELSQTHRLIHSFVESPTADNIYRGRVNLQNGQASVNIDSFVGMTNGTFSALNGNIQVFLQNDSGWDAVRGSVADNILTIVSQNQQSTDTISWLVIGERQDQHMLDTQWTDEFGRPILEPLKEPEPEPDIGA